MCLPIANWAKKKRRKKKSATGAATIASTLVIMVYDASPSFSKLLKCVRFWGMIEKNACLADFIIKILTNTKFCNKECISVMLGRE